MYNRFQLAKRYLRYLVTASNGHGHGVHSPFVFEFIDRVLNDRLSYPCYKMIEARRAALKSDERRINVEDFGAGSSVIRSNSRVVKDIARSSLKPKQYAQLLFRIVQYYKPVTMVELGTSLGTTSAYLASGNEGATLFTCEGAESIAAIAAHGFSQMNIPNVELIQGDFSKTLPQLFSRLQTVDFAFVDGNHREVPTLAYFHQLLEKSNPATILVFDDIHWSAGMEAAWAAIRQHSAVTLTIDLFFIGIVFVNPDFKAPQHFTIRF